jgi:hypothetical protein
MAFCSNCGAEVQGKFCAKCGTRTQPRASGSSGPTRTSTERLHRSASAPPPSAPYRPRPLHLADENIAR